MKITQLNLRYTVLISLLLIILASSFTVAAQDSSVETFRQALRSGNAGSIRQLLAPGGLILARSYNPSNPNRGKDLLIRVNDIPGNLQIPASGELPFDLKYLFGGSARSKKIHYLDQRLNSATPDESVAGLRSFALKVVDFVNQKTPSFTPTITPVGDRYLVLTEAESNSGMLSGSVAVFERSGGQFALKIVIDLR